MLVSIFSSTFILNTVLSIILLYFKFLLIKSNFNTKYLYLHLKINILINLIAKKNYRIN